MVNTQKLNGNREGNRFSKRLLHLYLITMSKFRSIKDYKKNFITNKKQINIRILSKALEESTTQYLSTSALFNYKTKLSDALIG